MVQDLGVRLARGLVAEGRREDDLGVFARFERQLVYVDGERVEQVVGQDGGEELEDVIWVDFGVCSLVSIHCEA